jgi:hypothetical protein
MTELMSELDSPDADDAVLAEAHAASAGLKALCTVSAVEGLEDLRKCCGGHGYVRSSLFALPSDIRSVIRSFRSPVQHSFRYSPSCPVVLCE